jgi:hypothetical protein
VEHLTKQQIVLLTLLVSFVTSLSTGIVTVSLMDQAPSGVTRTINQVIEKTIQEAAPQNASVGTVSINVNDQLASATSLVASSTVKIKSVTTGNIVGLGLVVTKNGLVITDKSIIDQSQSYSMILNEGATIPVSINSVYSNSNATQINNQQNNSAIYLTPISPYSNNSPVTFYPAQISSSYTLGQKVFSLTGTSSVMLNDGLITQMSSVLIGTSISYLNNTVGSPLFDIQGNVIGIQGSTTENQIDQSFYPIAPLLPSSFVQ